MTKATFNPATATGIVQSDDPDVLSYLAELPGPADVPGLPGNNEWAVPTGPNAFEVSQLAYAEVVRLADL